MNSCRAVLATGRFLSTNKPQLTLLCGGRDLITRGYLQSAKKQGNSVATFEWNLGSRHVSVIHPSSAEVFRTEIYLDNLASARADITTWPQELASGVVEIVKFLGLGDPQLALPLQQAAM